MVQRVSPVPVINATPSGDSLSIYAGSHDETMYVDQPVTIKSRGGTVRIGDQ